jgi:hypothetical protein
MTDKLTPTTSSPFNAPWSLRFERDGTEDVAVICDADGEELLRSRHFWLPEAADQEPPTLTAMRLIQGAPGLLEALRLAQLALNTAPRFRVGDTDSYQIAARVDGAIARAVEARLTARAPIQITEEKFSERFPLLRNHLNANASWSSGEEDGCLFETYDEELAFVRRQNPRTVWTLVDGDDDDQYLLSGFHFVNRIGYLVSSVAVPEGQEIEVRIPFEKGDDAEADGAGEA